MARRKKRESVNQFIVCGEAMDIINYKEFNVGEPNECWGFTVRVKTGNRDEDVYDVEYFTKVSGKQNAGYETIYKELKTIAKDGKGEIVRCNGNISCDAFYSNGELVKKIRLSGLYCNRKKDSKGEFEPGATFRTIGFIDDIKVGDKLVLDCLLHEYTYNNKVKGCLVNMEVTEKEGIKVLEKTLNVNDVLPLDGKIEKHIETIFLDASETEELSTEGAWGTELERINKINQKRKQMREEGIKRESIKLTLTGTGKALTNDEIETKEMPFTDEDIEEMFEDINEKLEKSKARDMERNSEDQPF